MTRESKIICTNNFHSADQATIKEEFNKKMAQLISRCESLPSKNTDHVGPSSSEKQDLGLQQGPE
jgi:hypothetical protein